MGLDVALVSLAADDIARLYRSEARRMAGFLVARTHDPEVALDLVAEAFASVVRDRRQFRGEGDEAAAAWVYGIARNLLSNWYRRGEVERRAVRRLGIERPVIGEAEYERLIELAGLAQMRARISAELRRLPDQQRVAVEMRVLDECSYEELSRALGISEQTARARVSRGLRALAAVIDLPHELAEVADG
jgi:RNA polymerase sigma factor (sigma-70 family)